MTRTIELTPADLPDALASMDSGGRKIMTHCVFPPIPTRAFDWCAYYDPEASEYGWGATEEEAIKDLVENYD